LINHGLTPPKIAETIRLPASLDGAWHGRAITATSAQREGDLPEYLGWYDANPVNLDSLPPVESGKKYISIWAVPTPFLNERRRILPGEFRFVAQAVSHLVFADPDNQSARAMLADTSSSSAMPRRVRPGATPICSARRNCETACPSATAAGDAARDAGALRTEQLWTCLAFASTGQGRGKRSC